MSRKHELGRSLFDGRRAATLAGAAVVLTSAACGGGTEKSGSDGRKPGEPLDYDLGTSQVENSPYSGISGVGPVTCSNDRLGHMPAYDAPVLSAEVVKDTLVDVKNGCGIDVGLETLLVENFCSDSSIAPDSTYMINNILDTYRKSGRIDWSGFECADGRTFSVDRNSY